MEYKLFSRGECTYMMHWSIDFSCGFSEIDEQHKVLIDIINKVSSVIVKKDYEFSKLVEIITDLNDYVEQHFKYEESLMKRYNYPEFDQHYFEHNELRLKLKDLNLTDIENHEEFYSDTLIYLVEWLTDHIMQSDKNLGLYIAMNVR